MSPSGRWVASMNVRYWPRAAITDAGVTDGNRCTAVAELDAASGCKG